MNLESFEDIKTLMDNFDPASLLPDLTTVVGKVEFITRIAVLVGPIVLLVMGLIYLLVSPKEANYYLGYRCYFGMGSVEAWRFTQRFAGAVWTVLGLVLSGVMYLLTSGFGGKEIMDIIGAGLKWILWEIGITVVSCLAINFIVMLRFNRRGERRGRNV